MSKLSERHETRVDHFDESIEALPEFPDDVTIPDDVSALTHPELAEEERSATGIRWMRWIALALVVVAGAVVAAVLLSGDTEEPVVSEATPWGYATEGPGSTSLAPAGVAAAVPWTQPAEGPGSTSLAPTAMVDAIPWTSVTEGPGSTNLAP